MDQAAVTHIGQRCQVLRYLHTAGGHRYTSVRFADGIELKYCLPEDLAEERDGGR